MSKEARRRSKLATLGEWAVITYGALLLIQLIMVFVLLVWFAWTLPPSFND